MLDYLHCYVNYRQNVDWNTCGTGAIATISDYHGRGPTHLARTVYDRGRYYWNDGQAIDAVKAAGFPPDVAFGYGTTGGRIRDALQRYGLRASVGYSGVGSWGWQDQWRSLQNYVNANRPVPVLVDIGLMGGPAWGHHWPIVYKITRDRVFLGNCGWNSSPTIRQFQDAWHCRALPYGFNHCGVYC